MNIERFQDGGFVDHGIKYATNSGKVSAWYDRFGVLQDCEFIDSLNRCRSIPENWKECYRVLRSIGATYSV